MDSDRRKEALALLDSGLLKERLHRFDANEPAVNLSQKTEFFRQMKQLFDTCQRHQLR